MAGDERADDGGASMPPRPAAHALEVRECQQCGYDLSHTTGVICPECGAVFVRRPLLRRAPTVSGAGLLVVVGLGFFHPILVAGALIVGPASPFGMLWPLIVLAPWAALCVPWSLSMALLVGVLVGPAYGVVLAVARWSGRRRVVMVAAMGIAIAHLAGVVVALAWL